MAFQQDPIASGQLSVKKRPLTSAEKQRNYRERLKQSPEKYERFRQKEAERQRERTKTRQKTEEEIAYQRMKWRERVRKHRLKKKQEALMNERKFQDVFNMSEGSTSRLVVPEGFIGPREVATDVSFNQNTEYSQDNTDSCLEMNLSEMNIGKYVMEAHHDRNRGESSSNAVSQQCNTPEEDDDVTHELNPKARSYFPAQHYLHVPSENGFEVGEGQVYDDGSITNFEKLPDRFPTGRTVLSLVEEFSGESLKKGRRKPLTPAERQRNYIARLKAQPEKWEQFKMRDIQRRKRLQEQNKMSEEVVSPQGKRQYQRRKRGKESPSSEDHMKETRQVDVCPLTIVPSHTAIECTQTNADSHLAKNSSEVNVEQWDLESHACSESFKSKDNCLKPEYFTLDMSGNAINATVETRDSFPAEKFVEMARGNGIGVGQSAVHARGGQNYVEENQDDLLTNPSIVVVVGGSHRPSPKRRPLTPAERQRKYRARLKAHPDKWDEYKSRDTERRKVTQKQNKSEEAAVWRRKKATEKQREYRRRKRARVDSPSTTNTETATSNTRINQSNFDKNLSRVKVEQCDLDTHASDIGKWKNDEVNVKLECISPDMSHNYADATVAVRDHAHKETFGKVTSENKCGVAQNDMCGDGSLTNVEEMQNHLPAGPSVSSPVGGLPGQSSKRRKPLTPAERQRQYRARLKAQPDKWEQYKARDAERRKRTQEQKRMSEAAALQRRIKARDRQRAYRRKKREKEKSVLKTKTKEMGQADVRPFLEEPLNRADISTRTTVGTGNVRATRFNQNKYRSIDFLQTNSDFHLDTNSSDMKKGQYAMEEYKASNNVAKPECSASNYGDNASHQVKLEVGDDFPAKHVVDPTSENGCGVNQSLICEDSGQDRLLRVPSISSLVAGRPRRSTKRRRTMTAAERQRNYRARRKAQLEMEEQRRSKDIEGPKNVQEQEKVSEDAAIHLRKKAAERTQVHQLRKREVAGLNTHGKSKGTDHTDVCPTTIDPHFTRTTRSTKAVRRRQDRSVEKQQTTTDVVAAEQRDERICSSTERLKQHTEAQLAYKRMKGRERMRKYRLRQKQKLKNACEGFEENDMPKIAAVWSMNEGYGGAQMRREMNTQYLSSKFDNSVPVCNLSNFAKRNTGKNMIVDDLAKIVPQDSMGSFYSSDSSPLIVYPMGSANSLANSDIPTALAIHSPQSSYSEEQGRGAFEGNVIPLKTKKLTSAERQRKYRERLQQNPEKWAAYKQKANERYMARKTLMTMKDIKKKRRQSLLRTRRWRAKLKESKDSRDNTLDDALDNFQNGISEGETRVSDLSFCDEKNMHYTTCISEKLVGLKGVTPRGRRGKKKCNKTPEEIERLRQANRERQRRHRAKKRGQLEQNVQSTINFTEKTEPLVLADCIPTNRVEKSENTLREGRLSGGLVHLQHPVESEIHCSTQFRICPNLSPSELVGPGKWGRPRINQIAEQPATQVRKRRGRPSKQSPMKMEQCTNPAINDTMVSPLGNGCPGEVLVSSAGNIPMVIKTSEVKGQQDRGWEEIPQVIPCDPPPEANFDWGNVDLDCYEPALDGDVPLDKVDVTEPIPGEGEGGCVSGSARRKAFFPTKHNTADLTLNAAWVVETTNGDQ